MRASKVKKKNIKIAIFHCGFIYTGGGERIVLEEIEGFRKRGYQVDCFVPTYDSKLSYPDILESYGIKTFLPQLPRFIPYRFAFQLVASCILAPLLTSRYKDYDVIFGANQPGAYMAWVIARKLKIPYFVYLSQPNRVLYPRDHEDWQNVRDYFFLNKVINSLFRKKVVELDQKSITESKNLFINGSFVAKEIIDIYKPKKWKDCPGGAHLSSRAVLKTNRKKGSVRANSHTIKKPYILFTSRHEPWKKFDWSIEIMKMVTDKYSDVRLVIPGAETSITPRLKILAKRLGITDKVIFTGAIKQTALWKLYENAYGYIFTSPKEDLGIVVQEAQANGNPVFAWASGGPTVTVKNKYTGYLIEPYYLKKMADRIVYLLNHEDVRNKMGRNAWDWIKKKFTWDIHVDLIEEEFKKVLKD